MKKATSKYVCTECGGVSPVWLGKCPVCGKFGTLVEEIETPQIVGKQAPVLASKPKALKDIEKERIERFSSGIKELDNVLGGGIVPYSIVLIGGDPGIGKSTILTQVSHHVSKTKKVLYVSAEESLSQVKMRCDRLDISSDNFHVLNECAMENIESVIDDY